MIWLSIDREVDAEQVFSALSGSQQAWLLTERLPDDQRPALVIKDQASHRPESKRKGPTVVLTQQKLTASHDPSSLIQGCLAQLGLTSHGDGCYQQLEAKERVIQQLLRYRATSVKYWLEKLVEGPLRRTLGRAELWSLWCCFERAQHAPIGLRNPPPVALPAQPVSIALVTPSFGQAAFLERTLESVLAQNYPWLDYWVQDGGSNDGSVEILRSYSSRLSGWESAVDSGQAQAINRGFERCQGEIMGWLNADDLLLPGTLNYVAQYFLSHPEVDLVYGQRVLIDAQDQEIGRWIVPPYQGDILSWADLIPQETIFWRRSLWDKVGQRLDESFQFALDWDLLLRFREAGARMARLPRFLGAFRIHPQQKTSSQLLTVGDVEMARLRKRSLGRLPDDREIFEHSSPFYRRAKLEHFLYRVGLRRID